MIAVRAARATSRGLDGALREIPLITEYATTEFPISDFMRAIVRLREAGYGYKRIARELRISRDEARHCAKLMGLGGVRGHTPPKRVRPEIARAALCARCGTAIEQRQRGRPAKFCSRRCRDAAAYRSRKEVRR